MDREDDVKLSWNQSSVIVPVKQDLLSRIDRLGQASILPGNEQEKQEIDALLKRLEESQEQGARVAAVLEWEAGPGSVMREDGWARRPAGRRLLADPRLMGMWDLIYASSGTAVTRTPFAQALLSASQLPGVGIRGIKQFLKPDEEGDVLASNEAEFGFGGLGSWLVSINGRWRSMADAMGAKVAFERLRVKPVGILGLALPRWLPEAVVSLGASPDERGGAEWYTTYLDEELRIGRGRTGNAFLFRRSREDAG